MGDGTRLKLRFGRPLEQADGVLEVRDGEVVGAADHGVRDPALAGAVPEPVLAALEDHRGLGDGVDDRECRRLAGSTGRIIHETTNPA
jgi:hypothetical protein